MRRSLVLLALALSACATASDRYQHNIAHEYLWPTIRNMPRKDIEEITRVVSAATMQDIVAIWEGKNEMVSGEVNVTTAFPGGRATVYNLVKLDGKWQIRWSREISDPHALDLTNR